MKQATSETCVYGAEFVAMMVVIEFISSLPDKLRMMDVLLVGPANIYGDNLLVLHNTQQPELTKVEFASMLSRVCLDGDASMLKLSLCSIDFYFTVWLENIPADIAMEIIPSVNEACCTTLRTR
jgi:hypothetical protein